MVKHTKKISEIYEEIQKKLFYMIPEKWESLYLYASVIEEKNREKGELYFYYEPKGIFRKKIVNVYEIPSKFNVNEQEYLKLVQELYDEIKELRNEFKKYELKETWSSVTIVIRNFKFMVEYHYEDLLNSPFSSYERHVIWRCKYLDIGIEQLNRKEKQILKKYGSGPKILEKIEKYEAGIYINGIQNIVDYDTKKEEKNIEKSETNVEADYQEIKKKNINQILSPIQNDKSKSN